MSNKSNSSGQVISLPKGGGALHCIGENLSRPTCTRTGNFSVPIALPKWLSATPNTDPGPRQLFLEKRLLAEALFPNR